MIYGYIRVRSDKQTVENQRFEINNFCSRESMCIDGWIEETINGTKSLFVQRQGTVCDFTGSDSWVILSPIEQSIKRKIEAVGTPLEKWDIKIYRGVLAGCNEAFIITTEKRDEILATCQTEDERHRTEELIRPAKKAFFTISVIIVADI